MELKKEIQKDFYGYKNRIDTYKTKIINYHPEICIERAQLITDFYKNTNIKSSILRFAKAIEYILSNMSIKIRKEELIVGDRTTKFIGTPLYPEVRIDSIEADIESYGERRVQPLLISEEDKRILKEEIIPFWKLKEITVQEKFLKYLKEDLKDIMEKAVYIVDTELTNGIGHFFPGHPNLLKFGIKGLLNLINQKMDEKSDTHIEEERESHFYQSLKIVLNAVKNFIQRYSDLSFSMAQKEENNHRKQELLEIAEICHHISKNPPDNFKQALQLIYFNHLICGLEDGGFAISIGRLDQYLYPYYRADLKKGIISPLEAKFWIQNFMLKINTLWNYVLSKGVVAAEGPPIAANLTIGGLTRDGGDATNELSFLILKAYRELKTVQPTFSVRIHKNSPNKMFSEVSAAIKEGTSIALFNDDVMIKGLMKRGFTLEDAREYAPIGCVEPQHPHKSFGSTNANQFNIVKCLELALTNGVDLITRKEYGLKHQGIKSYDDLWDGFIVQMEYFIKKMVSTMYELDKAIAELNPQPFLSTTTDACIESGLDITRGGAIYDFTGPQLIGLATVADSLATIKKFVFEEEYLEIEELVKMLKKNYRGTYKEKKGKEWKEIFQNRAPKFGNDNDYVDMIAKRIGMEFCNTLSKYTNYRGGKFNPGIYSTSFHLAFGMFTGATADGRKSKEPLSNGLCPTIGHDKNGPTAILNSVKKLDNELMTNGNSLILSFHPSNLSEEIFNPLIRSFFEEKGGFQIQFNVVGKEILKEAQNNPRKYPGLVVRIAGYSVLFEELSKIAQDEIINRTEY
jgi:pyruvate formate-lyase/glycerol dehydratase family glycyl radical enzyme